MSEMISFNTKVAKEVGVVAAAIYENIRLLCKYNRSNGKHIHNGRGWAYDGIAAIKERHDYLTDKQIRLALAKLEDAKYIISGNFNRASYDRTKWYCDLRTTILPKGEMDLPEREIPNPQKVNTIEGTLKGTVRDISSAEGFEEFWEAYNHKKGKEAALKVWKRKNLSSKAKEVIAGAKAYVKTRGNDARYFKMAQGWLNDGRWQDHSADRADKEIDWSDRLRVFEESGIWPMSYGPRPGMGGCKVPASLIQQQGEA